MVHPDPSPSPLAVPAERKGNAEPSASWRTIDSAPRDGSTVLLLIDGVAHEGVYDGPSDGALYSGRPSAYNWFSSASCSTYSDHFVTHWMPLPEPPAND